MEKLKPLIDFIKQHSTKILISLLVITYIGSCNKGRSVRKLEKKSVELTHKVDSLQNLTTNFGEVLRIEKLRIHQEYDLWISKKDRGEQLMDLHTNFVKPKIQELSK
jgi:hypothetical protein